MASKLTPNLLHLCLDELDRPRAKKKINGLVSHTLSSATSRYKPWLIALIVCIVITLVMQLINAGLTLKIFLSRQK